MEAVAGVSSPRVALLSNGTEASKGPETVVTAHGLLDGSPGLNFVGNVEGFAIGTGEADVIVADQLTGNVALKIMEGSSSALLGAVRSAALSSWRSKLGGMLLRPALRGIRDELSPRGAGRSGAAGAAAAGRRPARVVRGARLRAGDRGRRPRGARTSPDAPTHVCRPRGRCGTRPTRRLACATTDDARRSPRADP